MSTSITWEKDGRLILGSLAEERAAKVSSLRSDITLLKEQFSILVRECISNSTFVDRCIEFALEVTYTKSSLGSAYFSHPMRVAQYLMRAMPQVHPHYVAIALLHNVPETSAVTLSELEARFGTEVARGVGSLLVDRTVQFRTIVDRYYAQLFAAGTELTLVKLFDKLDNLLVLGANGDQAVRTAYIDEVRQKLLPWCIAFDSGLGSYLDLLLVKTDVEGFVPELNELIQALKRK